MIAVRIPEEIRKYKEKIMLGLNARQLISTIVALFICVPLYQWGKNYIAEDALSWIIILIALPILSIGFFRFNGMPMEKFIVAYLKFEVFYPLRRKYKVENAFREWQDEAIKDEMPKGYWNKRKYKKLRKQASLEKAVLMVEAEREGNKHFDADSAQLCTVKTGGSGSNMPNKPDDDKDSETKNSKNDKSGKSELQRHAEAIERRLAKDPYYVPTKKEQQIRRRWNKQVLANRRKDINNKKKSLNSANSSMKKRRTAKCTIPKTTQQTIPYIADYDEGLFEVRANKFSKVYRIQDINYRIAKQEEQIQIFRKLGEFMNYFSDDMSFAFCVDNRVVSLKEQEKRVLYRLTGDKFDVHRSEYNRILRRQIKSGKNQMQVEKFVTVTIDADTPIEALLKFHKIDVEIIENLRRIGSDARVLTTEERLSYYHDKYRKGREGQLNIDFDFIKKQGLSSKDYIAPSMMEFKKKHLQIEDTYYRVLHLCNLPASLSDELMFDICESEFPITTTINIQPVAQEKGIKIVRKQLTGIEKDKIDAEKRAIRAGYNPETIQHSIKDAHKQAELLYDDMLNKNQKMFFVTITCMVQGNSLEELEQNCKVIEGKARKYTTQMMPLTFQQEEGYKITLPFGYSPKEVSVERALTTESTAIFMPFNNQELNQKDGYYYGLNQISRNLVVVNRLEMKTPSGFVLGTSGSGKSFATKREILNVLLHDADTDILIIDPENEYGDFSRAFDGTVLKISADSNVHINPLDMTENYGLDDDDDDDIPMKTKKEKALKKKSDYIMSIVERMVGNNTNAEVSGISPIQKTIVDRCLRRCYEQFLDHDFDPAYTPTLIDLQHELDKEKDSPEGKEVAEGMEYYTKGSMNLFAHRTNINVENRLIVFNVRDLGDQLRQIALTIVFDFIWNRMVSNKNRGVRTYCYCDEIHVMFQSFYSANFLKQLYKRGRKYGLCITGVTQNVEDLLKSEQARGMIGNSDFIMMLNQNSEDLRLLSKMLNISEAQMGFVTNADAGSGLLFAEKTIVPFMDRFPNSSYLYELMSTKFGEDMSREEINMRIACLMRGNKSK